RTHNLLEPLVEGAAIRQLSGAAEQSIRSLQAERSRLLVARRGVVDGTLSARGFQEAIGTGSGGGASGGSGGGGLSIAGSSQGVLEQVGKLDDQIGEARSRYNPDSPMLQGLVERRRALLPLLRRNQLEAIDTALALNADRIEEARTQKAGIDQRFQQQPQLIREYDELQQKLNLALENLSGLRQAKENFSLELAQRTVPWRLIARPSVNPQPISPSVPRNLAMGLGLGLVAGVGAGLLRDRLDHVFHTPADAREDLQRPLLGHVPHVEFFQGVRENNRFLIEELDQKLKPLPDGTTGGDVSKEDQKLSGYQRFFYQEAFRNLFTSIRFLKTEKPLRSIAITSSLPNEGKSLVNVLLAKTLSEMGQRVLVVDADLRKPQMHYRLGFNNLLGLTNLLTEDHLRWQDLIQPVAGYENWSVLTSGRQPPDPARLLSSRRMKELVRELAESNQFDLILYDTPPVLGLADAALVSEHLDGLLLLVSLNRVDRDLPKEAISRITSSGVALLGIVTNAISPERLLRGGAYGYGYGRYGRYGYYGYNSGYSSYDPRNAYLYYQPGQDSEPPSAREEKPAAGTVRERAARLRRRLIRWIDQ
ncbi:MAG: polysaccharide biosynthesis tyrosine autokinase, partial [Cyanobacteriota bacterium]|nr:polysaccharide biosynthesis tyrosine autokinase [Cyanobacteriota bacterium]